VAPSFKESPCKLVRFILVGLQGFFYFKNMEILQEGNQFEKKGASSPERSEGQGLVWYELQRNIRKK
jgi:hypothetical protein